VNTILNIDEIDKQKKQLLVIKRDVLKLEPYAKD